jgi:hypothetical protein
MSVLSIYISQAESGKVAATLRWQLGYDVQPADCHAYVLNLVDRLEPRGGEGAEILKAALAETLESELALGWEETLQTRQLFKLPFDPEEDEVYIQTLEIPNV